MIILGSIDMIPYQVSYEPWSEKRTVRLVKPAKAQISLRD